MPMYVEMHYCNEHTYDHWQEVTRTGKVICRGESVSPLDTTKTYSKHSGRGYKIYKAKKIGMPLSKDRDREIHISQLQVDF